MRRHALLHNRCWSVCSHLSALALVAGMAAAGEDDRRDVLVPEELPHHDAAMSIDSGAVIQLAGQRGVIWETAVHVPGAQWLRLDFDGATLGRAPFGGQPTQLRLIAAADGAVQTMTAAGLAQWQQTSAYFNGDLVIVQIIADPGAEPSQLEMSRVIVGDPSPGIETICGPTDDRVASNDPRAARALNGSVCSAWLIDGVNNAGVAGGFLSAGHCVPGAVGPGSVIQFNVPLSTSGGGIVHPGPSDQYVVELGSLQFTESPAVGTDWAYFGCYPNSTTGLTAYEAQGDAYTLASAAPAVSGQSITITGYGSDSGSANFTEQTHTGPYFANSVAGTWIRYQTDTTGGNSGSPVEVASGTGAGTAIGIHTNAGCNDPVEGTANYGCSIDNAGLQFALANPQGICWPCYGIDTDGSKTIDIVDLLALLAAWGPCEVPCDADGDADGQVNVEDLLQLLARWGVCPPGGAPELPENDKCIDAIAIENGLTGFQTILATTDGSPHSPTCNTGSDGGQTYHDIWFTYTATCTGTLTVSTCEDLGGSADYDSDIVVYAGIDCGALVFLACNDDDPVNSCGDGPNYHSTVTVEVTGGSEYTLRVGGWNAGDFGSGSLLVDCN